ncbi:MAG: hypothetical protein V4591_04715 [Bdellovibrionota bacterium]
MLKKTTVYLSDNEINLLKKKATIQHKTVAEVIRLSIRQACQPQTKEETKLWDDLDKIWAQTDEIDPTEIEAAVDNAVNEVRGGKKTRRSA